MLSLDQLKPSLMFSQYEIANIKAVWLSLDLCTNFTDTNISTKNSIPMFLYDPVVMERFESELALNIFLKDIGSVVGRSKTARKYDVEVLDRYAILLSPENFEIVQTDYQVRSIINLITVMIYHLEYGKAVPQDYIIEVLKVNSRLYSLNCRSYTILGDSLIKTIAFFSNKFTGDKRQIFSKFISKLLTTLVYYSHDSGFINLSQIHENVANAKSLHNNNNNNNNNNLHDNQIHPTLTNGSMSTSMSGYSPPHKSSTMSIFSQPSECTEESSLLSLTLGDNTSELSSSEITPDETTNKPLGNNFTFNEGIAEETEEQEQEQEQDAEEATITQSYDEMPDDSYDYLNSFGLSAVDNSPIAGQDLQDMDDLRSLESTKSNMSSFKKWGKFKKSKKDKEKKLMSKNLVRTQTNSSFSSSRRSIVGEDEGCVIM
ncbi:hypothetical protein Cantr_03255 [Candida viswanathii]|uniref:Uncharacterized protein n=1 Tax=Candida viswanathii TaxID=5486 RepID=A0A367YP99_9ASCO|nr:hypothetical protein Cantr_03255 [Candida viswanathii]